MLTPPVFKSPSVKFFPINFCSPWLALLLYCFYIFFLLYLLLFLAVFLLDVPLEENDCNDLAGALIQLRFGEQPDYGENKAFLGLSLVIFLLLTILKLLKILISKYYVLYFTDILSDSISLTTPIESGDVSISTAANPALERPLEQNVVKNVPENRSTFSLNSSMMIDFIIIPSLCLLFWFYSGA